ncbi:hypothetical protein GUJ93_ZPchr0002g26718 [Zizania palustris]|uniref:Uncharacterized protein n=1 Tax=Zizania palustris TaxID=103762 RepID=A0A8J5VTG7_ZIZPA|nr:hypothetical protein GUJ93_ZPchr0002g26718 [Zizania palustris]
MPATQEHRAVVESSDERKTEEDGAQEERQLLYCVPIFDPAFAEFSSPPPIYDAAVASSSCFKEDDNDIVKEKMIRWLRHRWYNNF